MKRQPSTSRRRRSGVGRFAAALGALVVLLAGVPVGLIVASLTGIGSVHPLPAVGGVEEIRVWFGRGLSATEIAAVALRGLLIVGWVLWAAMVVSVLATVVSTVRGRRVPLPQVRLFQGLAQWIAAGLTVFATITPAVASARPVAAVTTPPPAAALSAAPEIDAPPAGFERVLPNESIATFAQRTLGDQRRWPEIWELNGNQPVGPAGEVWAEPWQLSTGSELRLPASTTAAAAAVSAPPGDAAVGLHSASRVEGVVLAGGHVDGVVDRHVVVEGESYWRIAERRLGTGAAVAAIDAYTAALIAHNAPTLGYRDATRLHPGDVVELVTPPTTPSTSSPDETQPAADGVVRHVVVTNDSYWDIARAELGAQASRDDVAALTQQLIAINAPLLGYNDPELLHPGDIVYFTDPAAVTPPPPSTAPPTTAPPTTTAPATTVAATTVPATTEVPTTTVPAITVPTTAAPATTVAVATVPAAVVDEHVADDGWMTPARAVLGLSVLATAGLAAAFTGRRRTAARGRPHQRPAPLPAELSDAARAVLWADVSDVDWLSLELRWLAHHCPQPVRASLRVDEIQVGADRDIEIAFSHTPLDAPPVGWTMAAERIWRLDEPHLPGDLADYVELPPLLPALVTLGNYAGGQLLLNAENHPGINVRGDTIAVVEWVTSVVWEIASGALAEHPVVLLVDVDLPGVDAFEHVVHATAADGLGWFRDQPPSDEISMFDRRTNSWDGWDTTLVVLGTDVDPEPWEAIAGRGDVALVALAGDLDHALVVEIGDGRVTVPAWNLTTDAIGLTPTAAEQAGELLQAAARPPVADELTIPTTSETSAAPSGEAIGEWSPLSAAVIVRLLAGPPRVEGPAGEIRVKPQPLAALAYIAMHREIALDDLRSAIWGDDQPVKHHRIRDLLSELRLQLGGTDVISHIDDGKVRAGPQLATDLAAFQSLAVRAGEHPEQAGDILAAMVELIGGRPFAYPSSAAAYWRWVDLEYLHAVWEHRLTTAAYELAELHLTNGNPQQAIVAARRGLEADPLNGPLTEMLMTAYAATGAIDTAQAIFEAHDRALQARDLDGASDETRRVLDELRANADTTTGTG